MYSLYSALVLAIVVVASPWFVYQALRYKKYVGSLGQRMGYLPVSFNMDGDESIWIHAVSVGEVLTARPLISDLKRINSHVCSIAYPILDSAGALAPNRLRQDVLDEQA